MIKELQAAAFKVEVLEQQIPVLVDFWAPWCGPCIMMAPVLSELSKKMGEKIKITKLNTDENQEIAMQYQITGIPCLILFKNGKEADRFVGVQPAAILAENIEKHINKQV
ncbi:MAG: thioredoxin [Candidatus Margulisbacteria bacterium]|nr:thioredoxin [Candidatus Margulisiibacteriota bacterium]